MQRDSFIFYRSFFESLDGLNDDMQLEIFKAIAEFSLNFKEPELVGVSKSIFTLIKPQLEANNKRYKNGTKPKQKQSISKTEAEEKQNGSKTEAKEMQEDSKAEANVNDNVNENNNDNKKSKYDDFIDELKSKVTIKSKVTKTKEGKKIFKDISDTKQLMDDYILHQEEKGNFAVRITAFMEDYPTFHSKPHGNSVIDMIASSGGRKVGAYSF